MPDSSYGQWLMLQARRMCGLWIGSLGLTMIILGDQRVQGPAYHSMRVVADWFDASPTLFWGSLAVTFGALSLWGRTKLIGLFGSAVWMACYCLGFWFVVTDVRTSPTGAITYSFIVLYFTAVYVLERRQR